MNLTVILSVVFAAGLAYGYPSRIVMQPNRQAYMIGGYYSNPLFGRSYDYVPQGAMSAVVTRDTVATNTFAGPNEIPVGQLPLEETETSERITERNGYPPLEEPLAEGVLPNHQHLPSQGQEGFLDEEIVPFAEEASTQASAVTKTPKKKTNRKSKKQQPQPQNEEEEEDEEEETAAGAWPFGGARGVPSYNAFFPITISGVSPSGRRYRPGPGIANDNEDSLPSGSATAIANAFSTGKGGIATSHATSLGDPYLTAMFLRNGMLNFKNTKPEQDA